METLLRHRTQKRVKSCLKSILLAVLAIQISSCTHTHMVIRQQPDAWAHRVNATAEKNRGKVYFKNGDVALAKYIYVSGDSVNWIERVSREKASANLNEVRTFTLVKKGKGAVEGLLVGLADGFAGGFLIGFASGDDPPGWFSFSAEEKGLLTGIVLGGLGGLLGLASGATSGSKDKYILSDEPADKPSGTSVDNAIRSPVSVHRKVQ